MPTAGVIKSETRLPSPHAGCSDPFVLPYSSACSSCDGTLEPAPKNLIEFAYFNGGTAQRAGAGGRSTTLQASGWGASCQTLSQTAFHERLKYLR